MEWVVFFELHVTFNKNILANSFICKWICYWNFYLVSRQPFYVLELKPFLSNSLKSPILEFLKWIASMSSVFVETFTWGMTSMKWIYFICSFCIKITQNPYSNLFWHTSTDLWSHFEQDELEEMVSWSFLLIKHAHNSHRI